MFQLIVPLLLMAGGKVLEFQSKIREGEARKKQYYEAARTYMEQSGQLAATTQEKLHDLEREKYYGMGAARALQASAGAKVGTGSALTQEKQIEGALRRKKEVLAKEVGGRRYMLEDQARMYRETGKKIMRSTRKAAEQSVYASLLKGGYEFGKFKGWWGV